MYPLRLSNLNLVGIHTKGKPHIAMINWLVLANWVNYAWNGVVEKTGWFLFVWS